MRGTSEVRWEQKFESRRRVPRGYVFQGRVSAIAVVAGRQDDELDRVVALFGKSGDQRRWSRADHMDTSSLTSKGFASLA
jgi:hypothetical protein